MKHLSKAILAAALLAAPAAAMAQNTYSGYFLDGYTYRYEMNPAFGGNRNFVSMPALGNLNIGIRGNLHVSDLIYKLNVNGQDKTVLFTNPGISASEAMSKFGNRNKLGTENKIEILAAGFKAFGGYNTISISATAGLQTSIPGAFFRLAKEGITNTTYDISDLFARATAYGQIALNHSRDIKQVPGLRVGAAIKFRVGVGNVDVNLKQADLQLAPEGWRVRTNADIHASVKGLKFDMDTYHPKDGSPDREYVSGANLDDFSAPNGFGVGFDLGATYRWRDFNFSLAVLDLGFMNWGKTQVASTDGTQEITTDSYTFNVSDDAANSFDNELDRLADDLSKLYQLKDMGEKSSYTRAMAATLNLGVDYTFPLYRNLHFALLNSTRIDGKYSWTQFRLSANVAPVKVFSATANIAMGTYGFDFGWLLNLHAPGFNLFFGMDHTVGKVTKQFVPLNSNATFNFGMNFPF